MKSKLFLQSVPALLLCAVGVVGAAEPQPNLLSDKERAEGWKLLFDGKTMNGWRGYKMQAMPPGWSVINGTLVRVKGGAGGKGAGGGDDIVTTEGFDHFVE